MRLNLILIFIGLSIAFYTQFTHLTSVPGLHFDEAWQGLFASRIALEKGFYPIEAMNSYTSPILHYFLAFCFKLFSPSLLVMRAACSLLNIFTLIILCFWLFAINKVKSIFPFILLWSLLPLCIHNHRFYIEVTSFHGFCFALLLWGGLLWKSRPIFASILIYISLIVGTYSHILFVAYFFSILFICILYFQKDFFHKQAQNLLLITTISLLPLTLRMSFGLKKILPFLLSLILIFISISTFNLKLQNALKKLSAYLILQKRYIAMFLLFASIPFLFTYLLLFWNGFWPYAQVTGVVHWLWLPINLFIFLLSIFYQLRRSKTEILWIFFLISFFSASIIILKQTPRYYIVPTIIAMLWISILWAEVNLKKIYSFALIATFVAWNIFVFEKNYIAEFENNGSKDGDFKFLFYKDSARDFRPFQKAFLWTYQHGCQLDLRWVDDDRFVRPVQFLQLTAPTPIKPCPWDKNDLLLSHIPNYDPGLMNNNYNNLNPPYPQVNFLAHQKEWGDLSFWLRKK